MLLAPFSAQLRVVQDLPQPAGLGHQLVDALADPRRVGDARLVRRVHVFAQLVEALADRSYQVLDRDLARLQVLAGQLLVLPELFGRLLAELLGAELERLRGEPLEVGVDLRAPLFVRLLARCLGALVAADLGRGLRQLASTGVPLGPRLVPLPDGRFQLVRALDELRLQSDGAATQEGVHRSAAEDKAHDDAECEVHVSSLTGSRRRSGMSTSIRVPGGTGLSRGAYLACVDRVMPGSWSPIGPSRGRCAARLTDNG